LVEDPDHLVRMVQLAPIAASGRSGRNAPLVTGCGATSYGFARIFDAGGGYNIDYSTNGAASRKLFGVAGLLKPDEWLATELTRYEFDDYKRLILNS
jgi:hypothetical protein